MKRLSISTLSLFFLLAMAALGFTEKPTGAAPAASNASTSTASGTSASIARAVATAATRQVWDVWYYWYDTSDNYQNFATVADEEYRLEGIYGVYVDQNSVGGTLLEKG